MSLPSVRGHIVPDGVVATFGPVTDSPLASSWSRREELNLLPALTRRWPITRSNGVWSPQQDLNLRPPR